MDSFIVPKTIVKGKTQTLFPVSELVICQSDHSLQIATIFHEI